MINRIDKKLLLIIAVLVMIGVVMVYSATSIMCAKNERIGDSTHYLKKDLVRVAIGVAGLIAASLIDYRRYRRFAGVFLGIAAVLLIATMIPRFAAGAIKGANRWLDFGAANLQPSEVVKLALIVFLAEYLSRKGQRMEDFARGFLPAVAVVAVFAVFIAFQPNYGMAIAITIIAASMFFAAGVKIRYMLYLAVPSVPVLAYAIMHSNHAQRRVMTFFYGGDPLGDAFQINQSLIAIGTGGIIGKGIGQGVQKLFYIPEIHTDFVFAVIGEELGFLGALGVLILFMLFAWRGLKIAMRAPDSFGEYLAIGIVSMVCIYAALNIGVVLRVLPTTGIPLPFISYGGSALLVTMISCGILLNISSQVRTPLDERISIRQEQPLEVIDARSYGGRRNRRSSNTGGEYCPGIVSTSSRR